MINYTDSYDPKLENSLQTWLTNRFGHEQFKPSFEKITALFLPFKTFFKQKKVFITTIGGTNGKGETAMRFYSRAKGHALWTSPHVLSIRERFIFNGKLVSYSELMSCFEACWLKLEFENLSFYEFLFFCFCELAISHKCRGLVLEVGLGGRLDAVNVFDPDLTCLTSIGRDHEEILGKGLKNILREKLGITRKNVLLVTCLRSSYLRQQVEAYALAHEIPHIDLIAMDEVTSEMSFTRQNHLVAYKLWSYYAKSHLGVELSLQPNGQEPFKVASLKGRFEKMLFAGNTYIFVGSHNREGLRYLTDGLSRDKNLLNELDIKLPFDRLICTFSRRSEDEVIQCLEILLHWPCLYKKLVLTTFEHIKAFTPGEWAAIYKRIDFKNEKFEYCPDWKNLVLSKPLQKQSADALVCLVTGSYYFIGEFQKYLLQQNAIFLE